MDAITAARQLGKAIQEDERFIRMHMAQEDNDSDLELQSLIAAFSEKRAELTREAQKEEARDQQKIKAMDADLKEMYRQIFENENMIRYSQAKSEFDRLLAFVNQIISGSAGGEDPERVEYQEGCGGDCAGCAGCS